MMNIPKNIKNSKDINDIKEKDKNNFMTPVKSDGNELEINENKNNDKNKNSNKKKLDNYEKDDILEQIQKMTAEKKINKNKNPKNDVENKENINSQKMSEKKNTLKKEKDKQDIQNLESKKKQIKKLSPDMLSNIPIMTYSNEKKENVDTSLNIKDLNKNITCLSLSEGEKQIICLCRVMIKNN